MDVQNTFFIDEKSQVFSVSMGKKFPSISTASPAIQLSGWVASEDFNFLSAQAPVYKRAVIEKTMPYMMEEYLLEPLATYHFNIIMSGRGKPVSIVAAPKSKMEEWLQLLGASNLAPEALYPDILALPYDDKFIHAYVGAKRSLVRTGEYTGFCGKGDIFFNILQEEADKQNKEIRITTEKVSLVPAKLKQHILAKGIDWLRLLSQAPMPNSDCNLLHSDYATKVKTKDGELSITRGKAVAIAASFLALLLFTDIFNLMSYKNQTQEMHARSKELYQQMFNQEINDVSQLRNRVLLNLQDVAGGTPDGESATWQRLNELSDSLSACANCNLLEFKLLHDSKRVSLAFESRSEETAVNDVLAAGGWRTLTWRTEKQDTPTGFYEVFLHRAIIEKAL